MRNITVYKYPFDYACEHEEQEMYRESLKANIACKEAIEKAISDHYRENWADGEAAVKLLLKSFSLERIVFVLANTVRYKEWDARFTYENKQWAKSIPVFIEDGINCRFVVDQVHPGLTDLLVTRIRNLDELYKRHQLKQK